MKLNQLVHFCATCQYGSISKAAVHLNISQPSISSSIKELETEFGINLFHRTGKRLTLTNEGTVFLEKAQQLLMEASSIESMMRDFAGQHKRIRVGIPPVIGAFLLPQIFDDFRKQYPDVVIEIIESSTPMTRRMLENNDVDLAIFILKDEDIANFRTRTLLKTQMQLCVPRTHRLASQQAVTIEEIAQESLVMYQSGYDVAPKEARLGTAYERFTAAGIDPRVVLHSNQIYTICEFVRRGLAASFLLREVIQMQPDLTGIPIDPPIELSIGLAWKPNTHLYSDALKFIRFVEKKFS